MGYVSEQRLHNRAVTEQRIEFLLFCAFAVVSLQVISIVLMLICIMSF